MLLWVEQLISFIISFNECMRNVQNKMNNYGSVGCENLEIVYDPAIIYDAIKICVFNIYNG
jgi:hypothetical protein